MEDSKEVSTASNDLEKKFRWARDSFGPSNGLENNPRDIATPSSGLESNISWSSNNEKAREPYRPNNDLEKKSRHINGFESMNNRLDLAERADSPSCERSRAHSLASSVKRPTRKQDGFSRWEMVRSSYTERTRTSQERMYQYQESCLHRSNSSLDLDTGCDRNDVDRTSRRPLLREYGSHGSIDVADGQVVHVDQGETTSGAGNSPKVRSKLHKLWDRDRPSLFRKLRHKQDRPRNEDLYATSPFDEAVEENIPGPAFFHYDVGSLMVKYNIAIDDSHSGKDKERLNVPTGASAAAQFDTDQLNDDNNNEDVPHQQSNDLVATCPFFRNEIGGESERIVGLCREVLGAGIHNSNTSLASLSATNLHRSAAVASLGLLEYEQDGSGSYWRHELCPFQTNSVAVEQYHDGAKYFKDYFVGHDYQNWFGLDDNLGPIAISVKKEKLNAVEDMNKNANLNSTGSLEGRKNSKYGKNIDGNCGNLNGKYSKSVDSNANNNLNANLTVNLNKTANLPPNTNLKKDKNTNTCDLPSHIYRIIIRTSHSETLKGSICESRYTQNISRNNKTNTHPSQPVRDIIEYCCPKLSVNCLKQGNTTQQTEEVLIKLDDLAMQRNIKVGVLYCKADQTTEEQMYGNVEGGPAFQEFLESLGQRVRLKDFDKYRGGLDTTTDTTGLYSVFTKYQDHEIMFHISTLLPHTPTNAKQLLRKRHIGNDIVTIVFQEPGSVPFSPRGIRSHFQHIFIVIRAIQPCTDCVRYQVAVSRYHDIPPFGPSLEAKATYPKGRKFTRLLLSKIINGQMAALSATSKFVEMSSRTRMQYLKELAVSVLHLNEKPIDSTSKLSKITFNKMTKHKERPSFAVYPYAVFCGASAWPLVLWDASLQAAVDVILAVSTDSLVLVEDTDSRKPIFATPSKSVIAWSVGQSTESTEYMEYTDTLRIFYHQGECLMLNARTKSSEAVSQIVARLSNVTNGASTTELTLKRNPQGLLGFNVQQDGVITEVEPFGLAANSGLKPMSRLLEVCTVSLSTIPQDQMVDLLKTSMTVVVTVVPPYGDGTPRRGCNVPTCGFVGDFDNPPGSGDYENVGPARISSSKRVASRRNTAAKRDQPDTRMVEKRRPVVSGLCQGLYDTSTGTKTTVNDHCTLPTDMTNSDNQYEYTGTAKLITQFTAKPYTVIDKDSKIKPVTVLTGVDNDCKPPPIPVRVFTGAYNTVKPTACTSLHFSKTDCDLNNDGLSSSSFAKNDSQSSSAFAKNDNSETTIVETEVSTKNSEPTSLSDGNSSPNSIWTNPYNPTLQLPKSACSRSEDEISVSSNSGSPFSSGRKNNRSSTSTPQSCTSSSPTNSSPSTYGSALGAPRPRKGSRKHPNRNSGLSMHSSNLQEELYRLINPHEEDLRNPESSSRISGSTVPMYTTRYPNTGFVQPSHNTGQTNSGFGQPSHNTGQTNSGFVQPSHNTGQTNSGFGQPTHNTGQTSSGFVHTLHSTTQDQSMPQNVEWEWTSLVDTATKAIEKTGPSGHSRLSGQAIVPKVDLNLRFEATKELKLTDFYHAPSQVRGSDFPLTTQAISSLSQASVVSSRESQVTTELDNHLPPKVAWSSHRPHPVERDSVPNAGIDPKVEEIERELPLEKQPMQHVPEPQLTRSPNRPHAGDGDSVLNIGIDPKVEELERELLRERQHSKNLEEQMKLLKLENIKLQQDSRAAAQQLHQFTEWFFNTIDNT